MKSLHPRSSMMADHQFFLGRQPIVGRKRELVAYELLFRSSKANAATVLNDVAASAAVIQHAFSDLGVQSVIGDKLGFINLSEALLMSDIIEVLPRERVVLEILETVPLTDKVVARCHQLKNAGYTLALDDVIDFTEEQKAVLPLVDVVKLDVLAMQPAEIIDLVRNLRPYGVTLLAEKIDTPEQRDFCQDLGFDLFQGYFFAKPTILSGRPVQPSAMMLLKLLGQVAADAETDQLEDTLKQAPDLTLHLLKLVNSVTFGLQRKISSVRTAITLLGRAQLNRWVQIMVFAQQSDTHAASDPVVQTAAVRGRLMEGLAEALGWHMMSDRAFMVGMLSLVDALFCQPLVDIIKPLNLDESVLDALLKREGRLGMLLRLVETSERGDSEAALQLMSQLGRLELDQFNRLQIEALSWANSLGRDEVEAD